MGLKRGRLSAPACRAPDAAARTDGAWHSTSVAGARLERGWDQVRPPPAAVRRRAQGIGLPGRSGIWVRARPALPGPSSSTVTGGCPSAASRRRTSPGRRRPPLRAGFRRGRRCTHMGRELGFDQRGGQTWVCPRLPRFALRARWHGAPGPGHPSLGRLAGPARRGRCRQQASTQVWEETLSLTNSPLPVPGPKNLRPESPRSGMERPGWRQSHEPVKRHRLR